MIKVIRGSYKNKAIKIGLSNQNRLKLKPTTAKIRESVFTLIESYIISQGRSLLDSNFLDLCCGTGAVGIEALSRGFAFVCFVDNNQEFLRLTMDNIIGIQKRYYCCILTEVEKLRFCSHKVFNIIFLDPPYQYRRILAMITHISKFMNKNTLLLLELRKHYVLRLPDNLHQYFFKKYNHCQIIGIRLLM